MFYKERMINKQGKVRAILRIKNDVIFLETLLKLLISKKHFEHFCPCTRCAILLKSKMTCDQLEKAASFLNTSGHDISDVFEPASDPLEIHLLIP